jgi:hypothetical protein
VNENEGVESTLAFLLSLAEMRRTQDNCVHLRAAGTPGSAVRTAFVFSDRNSPVILSHDCVLALTRKKSLE